mmetsp:Transcript_9802/g.19971  ORF Transcript_9802/g.19971 Transcript_9802/m.19971 type:complete len:264 (-) Transcript_9802:1626-2417(-)
MSFERMSLGFAGFGCGVSRGEVMSRCVNHRRRVLLLVRLGSRRVHGGGGDVERVDVEVGKERVRGLGDEETKEGGDDGWTLGLEEGNSNQVKEEGEEEEGEEFVDEDLDVMDEEGCLGSVEDDEIAPWVLAAARAGDQRKAENIVAMRVSRLTVITTFFLFMSARNRPQMQAIANLVEETLFRELGVKLRRKSGTPDSGWMLLDYGDLIVHIFERETREFYKLEDFWSAGERMDLTAVISEEKYGEDSPSLNQDDNWMSADDD